MNYCSEINQRMYSHSHSVQVIMKLERFPKSWSKEDLVYWYNDDHAKAKKQVKVDETDRSRVVFQSNYGVIARAHMTQGCQV